MPVTVIVEPNPGGHRFQAVANVAATALRDGDVVLLTSTGAEGREEFDAYLADVPVEVVEAFDQPTPSTPALAAAVRQACDDRAVARVVLMEGDNAIKTWWFVARRALRGLRPRPRIIVFLTRWPAGLERGGLGDLYYLKVRSAKVVLLLLARLTGTVDRSAGFAGRDERREGWLVKRARDPAICTAHSRDRAALRARLELSTDRRLVGIFGGVSVRKDPALGLAAVLAAGPDVDLVLAGPVDDEINGWLDALPADQRSRVIVRDAFLSNEELDQYLAASDIVLLLMRLEGPSGIMGKALSADVPVVTAGSKTRVRELNALHHGAATEPTVDDLARGLRQVLDSPGAARADAVPLPTGETFGATVLGVPALGAAASPSRPSAPVALARRAVSGLRNRARSVGVKTYLRPRPQEPMVRLGSAYGGWWVPESAARPGAVAYLAGAGEDITFDLALHERGALVRTLDPTPRAISFVAEHAPDDDRFVFVPEGVWDEESTLEFFSPSNDAFVSHSVVNLYGTGTAGFSATVKPLRQLVADQGDDRVDIVKLDIEGAEHRTLADMVAHGPRPTVLCVEFDQPQPLRRVIDRVRDLRSAGYTLVKVEEWNYTFTRPAPRD